MKKPKIKVLLRNGKKTRVVIINGKGNVIKVIWNVSNPLIKRLQKDGLVS